jgi:hypothetical protein
MTSQTRVLVRMRDVGLALGAADTYDRWLTRIQLQKFIYLLDAIGLIFDLLPPSRAHLTYKYGPYDAAIQNAVDSLAFRGFVTASDVRRSPEGDISARYQLSAAGHSWLRRIADTELFASRWDAALVIGRRINTLGWERLVDLVYAEPTFVSTRPRGYGQLLQVNNGLNNSAAFIIAVINRVLSHGFANTSTSRDLIVNLFFRYLDEFDCAQRSSKRQM